MFRLLTLTIILFNASGCASLLNSATQRMADNLTIAMLNQNDLETVKAGSPAYLIMIDSLIQGDPDNSSLLMTGSKLYASYTFAFVENGDRSRRLADKSLSYARKALCLELISVCDSLNAKLDIFQSALAKIKLNEQALLYTYGAALAGWIQVNADDWNAIAQIPRLNAIFQRSVELDEAYDQGGAHLYLAVLSSRIPPSLGGKPERGRAHFEQARRLSEGKNLMVNVLFAEHYSRLIFDQQLHDQLLKEVLSANVDEPGLTLINTLAKKRASLLLEESSEFF